MHYTRLILIICLLACSVPAVASEEGFKPLFDGVSLDGWVLLGQRGEGYQVQDGKIVCLPGSGGNLLSASEYSDFTLRFEFRLHDGSNNGLCLRCPMSRTDLAYDGNELQIIDNSSSRYKNIKPWQKHGSLYNVFPAKTGALNPVGEWNSQEVTMQGSKIQVILNGMTILDEDMNDVSDQATLARHPGIKRKHGHIGFLGHNEPIEFRNIRIKEID